MLFVILGTGGVYFPIIIGTMLASVKPEMRAKANSFAYFAYNILGFAPAPTAYGLIQDWTGGKTSRWGMVFIFYWGIWSYVFIIIVYCLKKGEKVEE